MSEPQQRAEVTLQGTEFRFHEDQRLVCFVHRCISSGWNSVWRVAGAPGNHGGEAEQMGSWELQGEKGKGANRDVG